MKHPIWKRAILSLFLVISFSCQKKVPHSWKYQKTKGQESKYSSFRLATKNNFNDVNSLNLELIKTETEFKMYLNIPPLSLPSEAHSNTIKIVLLLRENSDRREIFTYKLEGQQRLLLSSETRDHIINTLLDNRDILLYLGSYELLLPSCGFHEIYRSLHET